MKYIVYFTYKDEDRKLNEVPINTYETEIEAKAFRDAYSGRVGTPSTSYDNNDGPTPASQRKT